MTLEHLPGQRGSGGKTPAYRLLADDLRAQITSGRLRPGDRLPTEPQLCSSTGVSRSTVREALRLLSSEHLIVTTRGVSGGSFVAHPSPSQLSETLATGVQLMRSTSMVSLADLLEVREMIEVPAAGLAAVRRQESDLAAIRASLFDPAVAEVSAMLAHHRAFHGAIARACDNTLLELVMQPLHTVSNDHELVEGHGATLWRQIDADHRAIFEAVERRDAAGAERACAQHIANLREIFVHGQEHPRSAQIALGS